MLLTIFLAVVFCAAITLLLISAVAFVQYDGTNKWFFSSAPKEALELLKPRNKELFYGAKAMGWALMILHHVEGWRRFLDEAFRVLRPGGEMYINDLTRKGVHLTDFFFHWDHAEEPLFTMKEFEQQALKCGFATVKRCNYAGLDFCFKFQKARE